MSPFFLMCRLSVFHLYAVFQYWGEDLLCSQVMRAYLKILLILNIQVLPFSFSQQYVFSWSSLVLSKESNLFEEQIKDLLLQSSLISSLNIWQTLDFQDICWFFKYVFLSLHNNDSLYNYQFWIKETYFPGMNLAISAHLWPNNLCCSIIISSSSSEIGFLLIVGFKWLWYHSQHCFPVHLREWSDCKLWSLAISPQFLVPCYSIKAVIILSSSELQGCFLFFIKIKDEIYYEYSSKTVFMSKRRWWRGLKTGFLKSKMGRTQRKCHCLQKNGLAS